MIERIIDARRCGLDGGEFGRALPGSERQAHISLSLPPHLLEGEIPEI